MQQEFTSLLRDLYPSLEVKQQPRRASNGPSWGAGVSRGIVARLALARPKLVSEFDCATLAGDDDAEWPSLWSAGGGA